MAQIPSLEQWLKDTYSLTSPRSDFLKSVDAAIKAYHQSPSDTTKAAIKTALDRWRFEQSKQGKDWKKSVRNAKGAVTDLHRAVVEVDKRKLTAAELEAMKYIARSQAMALQKQFAGAKVQFKSSTVMGLTNGVGSKWQRFKTGAATVSRGTKTAKSVGKNVHELVGVGKVVRPGTGESSDSGSAIRAKIVEFCRELCPEVDPAVIFRDLNLGSVESFAADLAPFVGVISSGGKAILGWIRVAQTVWNSKRVENARYAIKPGDPEAAFDALLRILDRDIAAKTSRASVHSGAFATKTLASFADFGAVTGPTLGLLEILAEIFQTIVEYVRDYHECRAGNAALQVGALNLDLFQDCPILGCYFLVVQDHSTIINFAVGEYGTENWMFDVEQLVKKIDPVLDRARHYIWVSRLEVPGMSRAKGVVKKNYSVATGLSKVTGAPGALKDKIADRLQAWFLNPEKPPPVDRSRIIGIRSRD